MAPTSAPLESSTFVGVTKEEYKSVYEIHKAGDGWEGHCELRFPRLVPYLKDGAYAYIIKIQTMMIKVDCEQLKQFEAWFTRMKNTIEESGSYDMTLDMFKCLVGDEDEAVKFWNECLHTVAYSVPLTSVKML